MLKQQTEEPRTEWRHAPPVLPAQGRFDKSAAQEILETAARLQSGEQETLSRAEIEEMAAEMGISPRHVRQAITLSGRQTTGGQELRRVRLSQRQKLTTAATLLAYGLLVAGVTAATPGASPRPDWLLMTVIFALPFVLALWLGTQLRYKRAGGAAGALLITTLFTTMQTVFWYRSPLNVFAGNGGLIALFMLGTAILAGVGSAALRQWWVVRQPFHPQTAVKPSDLDR